MAGRIGSYVRQHHLALLCLFLIVGGGTAYALERNSVKSRHIKNGHVRTDDLAADAVNSSKLADGSVTLAHLQGRTSTVFSGVDIAASTCITQVLFALTVQPDDGVLVIPRRRDGDGVPSWDPRIVLDGYAPKAPDADETTAGAPGFTVRLCNISNEAVDDARLTFHIIGLR
jgi:hypothetical protein